MISYSRQLVHIIYGQHYENTIKRVYKIATDFWKMLPISRIPLKYVNYILLFGYEHHNKYKPIYYDTVFS